MSVPIQPLAEHSIFRDLTRNRMRLISVPVANGRLWMLGSDPCTIASSQKNVLPPIDTVGALALAPEPIAGVEFKVC